MGALDRRTVLAAMAGAAIAPRAAAQAAVDTGPVGQTVQVGPNVFAYIQAQPAGFSNLSVSDAGWIEGKDDVLVIDCLAAPLHAIAMRKAIAAQTSKPIRQVVITHSHGDHTGGLPYFMPADVIAHTRCRELMAMASPDKPASWRPRLGWAMGNEAWSGPILPTVTYEKSMTLWGYGDGPVEIFNPGPAHTAGDSIVRLPAARVAYLGDNGFFKTTPLASQAYITDLIAFLEDMMTWPVDTFVPGHGPIGTKADIADNRDYFVLLRAEARKGFDKGWSPARTAAEMDLGRFADWTDSDRAAPNTFRLFQEFQGPLAPMADYAKVQAVMAEYRQLKGLPPPPPPPPPR